MPLERQSWWALILLVAAVGCGSSASSRQCAGESNDAVTFRQFRAGTVAAGDILARVAAADGWPIQTCTGYLFALPETDSALAPYSVESPSGAFPRVRLSSEQGLAWGIVPIAEPAGATYRYLTFWGDEVPDGLSRVFAYDGGAEVSVVRAGGAHLERWLSVKSSTIAPRTVRAWVPAEAPQRALYTHDGADAFSPGQHLQSMAGPATLVVAIDAVTATRLEEYEAAGDTLATGAPVGHLSTSYVDFVQDTVRPMMESRYGVAARTAVVGCSAAGSAALKQGARHPGKWDVVVGCSGEYGLGHLHEHNPTLYEQWTALGACPAGAISLSVGGGPPDGGCRDLDGDGFLDDEPTARDWYCQASQLKATLEAMGCTKLTFDWTEGAEHCGASYLAQLPRVFSLLEGP